MNGQPTWSTSESAAVPVVNDVDPTNPTVVNVSVIYSGQLGLWLMTFDGGRNAESKKGVYFAYAPKPWGPWSTPQLIFNNCRDKGWGNFIFYYYATASENQACPGLANSSGPAGPTIGDQTANNPNTTKGTMYGPAMVERFTTISGSTLKIFYLMSTWNPYATVMMESDFNIALRPGDIGGSKCRGRKPGDCAEHLGRGEGLEPGARERYADLAGIRLRGWPNANHVGRGRRNRQWQERSYVYYISPVQINILTPPDAMNGAVQGSGHKQRSRESCVHSAGTSALAVVLRVQRRTLCRRCTQQRQPDWPCHVVSRLHNSGPAGRDGNDLCQRLRAGERSDPKRICHTIGDLVAFACGRDRMASRLWCSSPAWWLRASFSSTW